MFALSLKVFTDIEKVSKILAKASKICKSKIRFYEETSRNYVSSERENLSFCSLLARNPKSNQLCTECNEHGNSHCRETGKPYVYFCHSNLVEIVYPIFFDGIYVGHIGFGQFRSEERTISENHINELSIILNTNPSELKKKYCSQKKINNGEIESAIFILSLLSRELIDQKVFSVPNKNVITKVEEYVTDHLNEKITLQMLAHKAYLNEAYLSNIYKKATGMTITEYIRKARVKKAIDLFANSTMSIESVSKAVGYPDANYFTKVFSRETGLTPRKYKQALFDGTVIY